MKQDYEYYDQLYDLVDATRVKISNLRPSEWYEQNMVMPPGSAFPGPYRYTKTPYHREIIDCLSREHPAHTVAVMKGAQIGVSAGVLTAAVGYIIAEAPANTLFLTGHSELTKEAVNKLDQMIDNTGIRHLLRSQVQKKNGHKTGDTDHAKEFVGGSVIMGSATNHNLLRQRDIQNAIIDDFDAAKKSGKETGNTTRLIEQRTAAFAHKRKIFYVSTPQLKSQSNIEPAYLLGDQRKWHTPCPNCGELIVWEWETHVEGDQETRAGITWDVDELGQLVDGSVGYTCQKCGEFYDDSQKADYLNAGEWIPTKKPSQIGYYSYHISALYAPPGMFDWEHYVRQWLEAHPKNQAVDRGKLLSFYNLVLGQTYEEESREIKANDLQKNQRDYAPGTIPEKQSIADGNGRIVLLTFAADMNGKEDDARLDWEISGWTETESKYSISHGSIGTFVPREKSNAPDRKKWTYKHNTSNSVWPQVLKIITDVYHTNTAKPRRMKILLSGIDVGYLDKYAFPFIDANSHLRVYGLKGDPQAKYTKLDVDKKYFKRSQARGNMYILETNRLKDTISECMSLTWNPKVQEKQPSGFMNFPMSENGLYQYNNYFRHFEAEKRKPKLNALGDVEGFTWVKKSSTAQNHLFDCAVYNLALKAILTHLFCKEQKIENGTWQDVVDRLTGK